MPSPSVAIVWFRRDLRVHDHPALMHALERYDRVIPLYVLDPGILEGRWQSANRRWFLAGALGSLEAELRERDSALTVASGDPRIVVPKLATDVGAAAIVASRDYTPYGRDRDAFVERAARDIGTAWAAGRGVLAHEPEDIRRDGGGAYMVFSPFHRKWQSL